VVDGFANEKGLKFPALTHKLPHAEKSY